MRSINRRSFGIGVGSIIASCGVFAAPVKATREWQRNVVQATFDSLKKSNIFDVDENIHNVMQWINDNGFRVDDGGIVKDKLSESANASWFSRNLEFVFRESGLP